MLYKNTLIKIKKSFGRFISLFIIVLVGAGFFAGIQASAPDIISAVSRYNDSHKLMDFQIVSTMGLTSGDVNAIKSLKDVNTVVPSYSLDVLDNGKPIRVQALENSVDTVELVKGRMPQNDTECVADSQNYKLGDRISVTSDVKGKLKDTKFTVVGTVQSPMYLSKDYGNTTVGDGTLTSFIFVNKDVFTLDAYTEIYVRAAGSALSYSEEYDAMASRLDDELVKLKAGRENARYQEIHGKAADEIESNEVTLETQKANGQKQLADAKSELDANSAKLSAAEKELSQNETELQDNIATQNASFQSAKSQIADGRARIDAALSQNGLTEDGLGPKIDELDSAIRALKKQQSALPAGSAQYNELGKQIAQYSASYQGLVKLRASLDTLNAKEAQLDGGIADFNSETASAGQKLSDGKTQLSASEKKLADGYSEYDKNLASFNAKIADAGAKLDKAKAQLADIEKPQWTIFGRDTAVAGYNDVKSGTDSVTSVAKIFPLFFILIVLLMTSNTMARMIAEERGELGTLASLGFKDGSIIATYLLYVLSATVSGAVIGYFAGCAVIPKIIYACFPYILPPLTLKYDPLTFLLILFVAVAVMTTVTVVFCLGELSGYPAGLMRPVPPKNGKTILLEKIGFVWKRLSFTWKVTLRNLFRYKQRVAMTVVGIAGCTALLLTGFGIKDSIGGVAQRQYGGIFKYDDLMVLKNETRSIGGSLESLLSKEPVQNPVLIRQTAFTCVAGDKSLDAYLIVPENVKEFYRYFTLDDPSTGKGIALDGGGVVISQKIANTFKVGKGGKLTVKDSDNDVYTLPVAGVTENHMQDYIYMDSGLYGKVFGKAASYNIVASDFTGDKKTLARDLIGSNQIVNVNFRDDMLRQAYEGDKSLDSVVVLLVCIASILMVIVLYNLTSINISERKREIATLKVLGFGDGETNEYVYREALLLTLLSIAVGLALGVGVHRLVMGIINSDTPILFFTNIKGLSFLWTFLITMAVSAVMQVVTYLKLQTIDMIESLKSVE